MSRRDTIRRAKEIISARHADSISTFELHTAEAKSKIAGYADIDREIASTGLKVMAASIGKDNSVDLDRVHAEYDKLVEAKRNLLLQNGYPADYCDVTYFCEKCSDTGYCGIEICNCLKKEIVKASLEDSGLYSLTSSQTFDSFSLDYYENHDRIVMEQNVKMLRSFSETFVPEKSDSFLFVGGTGLGKTHLSSAVATSVIKRGAYVVYESAIKIFGDFEVRQFSRNQADEEDTERYFDCDLLIIDDLGCEMTNQFTVSCLYHLINSRMLRRQSTIISTNLSQNELRKRYSDRIISRIFGEFKPLLFQGSDIREQKIRRSFGQK